MSCPFMLTFRRLPAKRKTRAGRHGRPFRRIVWERDGGRCRYCGDPVAWESFRLDHIVPVSRCGSPKPVNLAAACVRCDRLKGPDTAEDVVARLEATR